MKDAVSDVKQKLGARSYFGGQSVLTEGCNSDFVSGDFKLSTGAGLKHLQSLFVYLFAFFIFSLMVFGLSGSKPAYAADQENCMFCHQYPLLGIVDDNGTFSSYYVDNNHFAGSVHSQLMCSECHSGITKIPHEKDVKITCTNDCHMDEPTSGRKFSHKQIEETLKDSAHYIGYKYVREKSNPSDFPTCVSCHSVNKENTFITPSRTNLEHVVLAETRGKCFDCHSDMNSFVSKNIVHVVRRVEKVYSQKEIMSMCVSCHNNPELNERHNMVNAIYTYLDNFHGRVMLLGLPEAPSCLDCHVKLGESPHSLKSVDDPTSATFSLNRGEMCVRADCHPGASLGMGKGYVHVMGTDKAKFPIEYYLMYFFTILTAVSFVGLMVILVLEMLRMVFPNWTIIKQKGSNKHEH